MISTCRQSLRQGYELYICPFERPADTAGLNDLVLSRLASFTWLALRRVRPLSISKSNYMELLESLALNEDKLMLQVPNPFSYVYEGFVRALGLH
jgi:hypothetical protein